MNHRQSTMTDLLRYLHLYQYFFYLKAISILNGRITHLIMKAALLMFLLSRYFANAVKHFLLTTAFSNSSHSARFTSFNLSSKFSFLILLVNSSLFDGSVEMCLQYCVTTSAIVASGTMQCTRPYFNASCALRTAPSSSSLFAISSPNILGNMYEEQPSGVWPNAAKGVRKVAVEIFEQLFRLDLAAHVYDAVAN